MVIINNGEEARLRTDLIDRYISQSPSSRRRAYNRAEAATARAARSPTRVRDSPLDDRLIRESALLEIVRGAQYITGRSANLKAPFRALLSPVILSPCRFADVRGRGDWQSAVLELRSTATIIGL